MFRPRIGQQLLMAIALGLVLLPSISWATTITITAPYDAFSSTQHYNAWTVSASSNPSNNMTTFIANDGQGDPNTNPVATYFGTLDLNNNYAIIHPDLTGLTTVAQKEAAAINTYTLINDMARSGYNVFSNTGTNWNGTGITSNFAKHDPNQTMAVGVILNDGSLVNPGDAPGTKPLYGSNGEFGPWFGNGSGAAGTIDLTPFDTLIRYTWKGDTLLRGGRVDDNFDLFTINSNVIAGTIPSVNTWAQGDLNYFHGFGAPIDGNDLAAAVTSQLFFDQGTYTNGVPVTYAQTAAGLSSVPEPSSLVLGAMCAVAAALGAIRSRKQK